MKVELLFAGTPAATRLFSIQMATPWRSSKFCNRTVR
jgi:hypothetical protein